MTYVSAVTVPLKKLDDMVGIALAASELRKKEPRPRIEFTPPVKKILGDRSGWKCSYRRCLRDTTGPTETTEGKSVSARTGVASHIHAAREGGPRWNPDLTEQQVKDVENGIWLCTHHGNVIDVFVGEHPPATLVDMKKVRDFAQQMTMLDEDINRFVIRAGVHWLDEVVWKHWPDPDRAAVREDLAELAEALDRNNQSRTMPSPPGNFTLKKVVKEVKSAVADAIAQVAQATHLNFLVEASFQKERRRAVSIAVAWARSLKVQSLAGRGHYLIICNVKLSARNPETGELCDGFIWTEGSGELRHEYTLGDGERLEIRSRYTSMRWNNLDWHLDISIRDGRCSIDSTLRVFGQVQDVEVHNYLVWEAIERYSKVVEKLVQGWEPIGFVGLETGICLNADAVHPEPFEIKLKATRKQLEECLYRFQKLKLGKEIAEEWGFAFLPTPDFFCGELDEATIRKAADALVEQQGPGPYWYDSRSEPLVTLPAREIRLVVRNGCLFFASTPIRARG